MKPYITSFFPLLLILLACNKEGGVKLDPPSDPNAPMPNRGGRAISKANKTNQFNFRELAKDSALFRKHLQSNPDFDLTKKDKNNKTIRSYALRGWQDATDPLEIKNYEEVLKMYHKKATPDLINEPQKKSSKNLRVLLAPFVHEGKGTIREESSWRILDKLIDHPEWDLNKRMDTPTTHQGIGNRFDMPKDLTNPEVLMDEEYWEGKKKYWKEGYFIETFNKILDKKRNGQYAFEVNGRNSFGEHILFTLIRILNTGSFELDKKMFDRGISIEANNSKERYVYLRQFVEKILAHPELGSNLVNKDGETPLMMAIRSMCDVYPNIGGGSSPYITEKDKIGWDLCTRLIAKTDNINRFDKKHRTVLHLSLWGRSIIKGKNSAIPIIESIKKYKEQEIDFTLLDGEGRSYLTLAMLHLLGGEGAGDTINWLIDKTPRSVIEQQDREDFSCLCFVLETAMDMNTKKDLIKKLLAKGASDNVGGRYRRLYYSHFDSVLPIPFYMSSRERNKTAKNLARDQGIEIILADGTKWPG